MKAELKDLVKAAMKVGGADDTEAAVLEFVEKVTAAFHDDVVCARGVYGPPQGEDVPAKVVALYAGKPLPRALYQCMTVTARHTLKTVSAGLRAWMADLRKQAGR